MARFDPAKTGFVAGELSPILEARDDIDAYAQGMRLAQNGIILPHGGFKRRPGTRYVAEVKDSADAGRLIEFISSVDAAYVIEVGDLYFRYYVDEGRLESPPGTPVETTTVFPHTALADLYWTQSTDTLWVHHPDYHPYKLQRTSATTFTMTKIAWREGRAPMRPTNLTTTTITATKPGTPVILTASAALWTSGNDIGRYVRHTVGATTAWYRIDVYTSTTVVEATLMGGTTTVALGAGADFALGMFSNTEGPRASVLHGGRLWFGGTYNQPDRIVGSTSDDFDHFEYGATDDMAISRRVTSGGTNAVQWLASVDDALCIGTQSGEFAVQGDADGIITPTACFVRPRSRRGSTHDVPAVVGDDVVFIQRNARKLRDFHASASAQREDTRELTLLAEHVLNAGATEVRYQQDPHSVVWAPRGDGELVGITREPAHQVYAAHRHILGGSYLTGNPVVESIAVIPSPDGDQDHLWMLVARTVDGATQRYVEFMTDDYRPSVTSRSTERERIAAVEDAIFLDCSLTLDSPLTISGITKANPGVVTATSHGFSNGNRVRIRDVLGMTEVNHTSFIVAGVTANTFQLTNLAGTNVDTSAYTTYVAGGTARKEVQAVSGLSHLEGQEVQIIADGCVQPVDTVSAGAVQFTRWGSIVHVGLACPYEGETQRFFGGSQVGAGQGNSAVSHKVGVRIHNTVGLEVGYGPEENGWEAVPFRQGGDNFDEPPALRVSDDIVASVNGGTTRTPVVRFRNTDPLPVTLLGVYPRMESEKDQ